MKKSSFRPARAPAAPSLGPDGGIFDDQLSGTEQSAANTPGWAAGRDRLTLVLLIGAFAGLAVPVLLVAIPPLLDYPNHLVRLWLISGGAAHPPLSEMYAVSWSNAFTNLGIDYLGALLGRFVPVVPLGSFFLLLALILPPIGAVCLNRATFGGLHWSQIAFAFFAWNATLLAGFLNFQIGVGLALLGAALDRRLAASSLARRSGARLAIALALLIVHVFALFFYCALIAGLAFGRELKGLTTRRGLADRAAAVLAAAGPAALPALIFVALAPALPGAHTDAIGNAPLWDFSLYNKGHVLLSPIATYALPIDLMFTLLVLAPGVIAAFAGRLRLHAGLMLAAAGTAVLAVLSPTAAAGTWWIDNRFPIMSVLALLAGVRPELPLSPFIRMALPMLLAGAVTARTAWITSIWHAREADIAALHRAVAQIPAGSAVLPLDNVDSESTDTAYPLGRYFHNGHPTHWSFPVLAIMWRQAFVPNIFWAAGKQPLRVLPPWSEISYPEDGLWASQALVDPKQTPAYFAAWRQRYDYVLLLNADGGPGADLSRLPELRLERDEGFARLYRVISGPRTRPPG